METLVDLCIEFLSSGLIKGLKDRKLSKGFRYFIFFTVAVVICAIIVACITLLVQAVR